MSGRSARMAGGRARRRCAAALLAGVLLPALLGGCSTEDPHTAAGAPQSVAVADRAELLRGGDLAWGVDRLPATLNAFQHDAEAVTDRVAQAVLPHLFTQDHAGSPALNPDYLESAEVTAREPKQTVTYQLNPQARWSDGEPLHADDFVAQWKALNGQDSAYWTARNVGYDRIENVEPGGAPGEVRVTFAKPYADWPSLFTPLYPRSVTGDPDTFNNGTKDALPVSGGPFQVRAIDRDRGRLALVRNDEWWGDPALLDALVFVEIPREERIAAMARGNLQIAEVDPSDADRIEASAGSTTAEAAPERGSGAEGEADRDEVGAAGAPPAPAAAAGAAALATLAEAAFTADPADAAATSASQEYAAALVAEQRERDQAFAAQEAATSAALTDVTVHRAYSASYTQLALNGTSPALKDERVRWALARALDRTRLASVVHEPAGLAVEPVGSHLWVPGQEGYRDTSGTLGETGPEPAAALLEEAGWRAGPRGGDERDADGEPGQESAAAEAEDLDDAKAGGAAPATTPVRLGAAIPAAGQRAALLSQTAKVATQVSADGDYDKLSEPAEETVRAARAARVQAEDLTRNAAAAVRVKEGASLQLRFVIPEGPGAAELRTVADEIVAMLGEVGVHVEIAEVPGAGYFADHIVAGDFDLALYSWPASAYPATDARPVFAKPQSIPGGELFIEQNYSRVGTDHIDQLLDQAGSELDPERRAELLEKADVRIWNAAGSLPLYQSPELVATAAGVAGAGAWGLQTPRFQDIGFLG